MPHVKAGCHQRRSGSRSRSDKRAYDLVKIDQSKLDGFGVEESEHFFFFK